VSVSRFFFPGWVLLIVGSADDASIAPNRVGGVVASSMNRI